jgi:hypothetical protein
VTTFILHIMQLKSDVVLEAAKFDPANNPEHANKVNKYLIALGNKGPQWFEVSRPICSGIFCLTLF